MKISVTFDDILAGVKCDPERCPVALALKRSFPADRYITVGALSTRIGVKVVYLPGAVTSFVNKFDRGMIVRPFEFEIPETQL